LLPTEKIASKLDIDVDADGNITGLNKALGHDPDADATDNSS